MNLAIDLAERGVLPDPLLRIGMRRLLAGKLASERAGGPEAIGARHAARLDAWRRGPLAIATADANRQHYELPPEYFVQVLGPRLKYSCGWWDHGGTTLAESEDAMLERCSRRAGLADGQRILELGCGWGSWSLWMAERHPRAEIVAVSNSHAQREYIERAAARIGLRNLAVHTADVSTFTPPGDFDRVVSVEMFEHLRNWEAMFGRIAGWLRPGGTAFVHVFCHREYAWPFEDEGERDWMARHFFTGGIMPGAGLFRDTAGPLRVTGQWIVEGTHYARTLRAWLARHDANRAAILPVLARVHGSDAARAFRRWRMFYLACMELFAWDRGREWGVTHVRLAPESGR